ncbi:hypothetical protein ACEOWJ_002215 [Bacillus cereus]|uniref:hypothetical protein n=1 Tax=Bacillus TaxID=1386 RepID=UPI0006910886|nr:hypothetical protein [Bacillus sp. UNC322MFChir4.1]
MSVLQEFSRFQSLRIPATWFIVHNNFMEMNPEELNVDDKKGWSYFTVDLLQVKHQVDDIILDVGWYPEMDPKGSYKLQLVKDGNWQNPVEVFYSKNREEVVKVIEALLWKVKALPIFAHMPKFQSLRIPELWSVTYNGFLEINPEELEKGDKIWLSFTQDLLQLEFTQKDIILDVGWYPEGDPDGMYGLELIKNKNWHEPLETFDTRNKEEVVQAIEMLLLKVRTGYYA